jgi:hypothetical protein
MNKKSSYYGKNKISWSPLNISLRISILSLCIFFFSDNKVDPDLWGHLKFGEEILRSRSIPFVDTYSYSAYGLRWTNHEWLSELIFYVIYLIFGSGGLIAFKVAVGILMAFFIHKIVFEMINDGIVYWILMALALSNISFGFATRPQIFTYLFFSLYLFYLHEYEIKKQKRFLLFLIPIMAIWTNLHGGFVAGLGTYFIFAISKGFRRCISREIIIPGLLILLITLLNPYSAHLWTFIYKSLTTERPFITEWQGFILSTKFLDYYTLVLISGLTIFFSREKKSPFDLALLGILTILSILHNRHIPLFSISATVFISKQITAIMKDKFSTMMRGLKDEILIPSFLLISIFFIWMGLSFNKTNPFKIEIPNELYPVSAIKFIKENEIMGNIFPYFDWGEYVIWELHRTNRVFFDGRFETVYPPKLLRDYFRVLYGEEDPKELFNKYPQTDIILLPPENPLLIQLKMEREWIEVFRSKTAVVLLRDNEKNKRLIMMHRSGLLHYPNITPPCYLD